MIKGLNEKTLKRLYLKEKKSLRDIGKIFGFSRTTIQNKCRQYGIKLRPLNWRRIEGLNKSNLQRLYIKEGKSTREIAEMFSCSPITIEGRYRKYGIVSRARHEELNKALLQKLYVKEGKSSLKIAEILGCSSRLVRKRCRQFGIKLKPQGGRTIGLNKSVLQRLYIREGKSMKKIAEIFSCSYSVIRRRCIEYGIKITKPKWIKELPKVLRSIYFDKGQLERLDMLSAKTRVPKAVYIREALDLVLGKYENELKGRQKKRERR